VELGKIDGAGSEGAGSEGDGKEPIVSALATEGVKMPAIQASTETNRSFVLIRPPADVRILTPDRCAQ
jgi:hypothetical protein